MRLPEDASGNPDYDGATLAAAGTVVIGMNYRLGVEGFAHIDGAPDNRGLLDQSAALRWVQDNVTAFGGDPANVTVFVQSAGAGSVAALLAMPAAAGLLRRAIVQSLPGTYFSPRLARAVSAAIAAELGIKAHHRRTGTHSTARPGRCHGCGAADDAAPGRCVGPMALTTTPFSPVVNGDVLRQAPWSALASGTARGIDLIVGHTETSTDCSPPGSAVR